MYVHIPYVLWGYIGGAGPEPKAPMWPAYSISSQCGNYHSLLLLAVLLLCSTISLTPRADALSLSFSLSALALLLPQSLPLRIIPPSLILSPSLYNHNSSIADPLCGISLFLKLSPYLQHFLHLPIYLKLPHSLTLSLPPQFLNR
jgi:hypothetical protein